MILFLIEATNYILDYFIIIGLAIIFTLVLYFIWYKININNTNIDTKNNEEVTQSNIPLNYDVINNNFGNNKPDKPNISDVNTLDYINSTLLYLKDIIVSIYINNKFNFKSVYYFLKNRIPLIKDISKLIIQDFSIFKIIKYIGSTSLLLIVFNNLSIIRSSIIILFSLCLGLRSELSLTSDSINMLATAINSVNENIHLLFTHTNNNINIINAHLEYQDNLLKTILSHITPQSNSFNNNSGIISMVDNNQINNMVSLINTSPLDNINNEINNSTDMMAQASNQFSNVSQYSNMTNINPQIFGEAIHFNNNIGLGNLRNNNVIIQNAVDVIRVLSTRPNTHELINDHLYEAQNLNNEFLGGNTNIMERILLVVGLISLGALSNSLIRPVTITKIIITGSNM